MISCFEGPWKIVASVASTSALVDLEGSRDSGDDDQLLLMGKRELRGMDARMCKSCLGDSACAQRLGDRSKELRRRSMTVNFRGLARKWEGYEDA